jgi:hypothetical protein
VDILKTINYVHLISLLFFNSVYIIPLYGQQEKEAFYFYEPYPLVRGSSILQLGASVTLLPIPIIENEFPTPAIDLQYKYGILNTFAVVGSFSTNYLSNLLHAGIQWNTSWNRFSIGIANHIGGFYGYITADGMFDANSAYGAFDMPMIRFGWRFDNFSASMSWAFSYVFRSYSDVNGIIVSGPEKEINDIFCTIAVEQPFLKNTLVSIGFSLTYARSPYQSWLLHNTFDHYLISQEFFFAVQL